MSEALVLHGQVMPTATRLNQMRLAKRMETFDPEKDTFYQVMLECGYSEITAKAAARRTLTAVGFIRAREALEATRADTARSLDAASNRMISKGLDRIDELDARELIHLGLAGKKTSAEIGETVEQHGDAGAWKLRQRRAIRLGLHLGFVAGVRSQQRIPPPTTATAQE